MSFEIKLPLFEGPFDLLLFFIERDELDIYDIPISDITKEFIEYMHQLEKLNMEVASEFILVAATLMRIKSKMLLPRPELDEDGNEIDPREELIQHLLEYKRYKSVVGQMAEMESSRLEREARGNLKNELTSLFSEADSEAELQSLDLYKLLKVFNRVWERYEVEKNKPRHEVVQYPYTISRQKKILISLVKNKKELAFSEIIQHNPDKIAVIFNFLAILEMIQQHLIGIRIGLGLNNFWLVPYEGEEVGENASS